MADASGAITAYTLRAAPREAACTQWKNFLTDQSGAIHESTDLPAAAKDATADE